MEPQLPPPLTEEELAHPNWKAIGYVRYVKAQVVTLDAMLAQAESSVEALRSKVEEIHLALTHAEFEALHAGKTQDPPA